MNYTKEVSLTKVSLSKMEDLLFDTTILQVFNVVLSFYAVPPAAVEY